MTDEVNNLKAQITQKDTEINNLKGQVASKDKEINDLKGQNTNKDTEINKLNGQIASKDKDINDLKGQISSKDKEINDTKAQIPAKDTEINNLKAQIASKDKDINDLKGQIANKEKENCDLKGKISSNENDINDMKGQISSKDKVINETKSQIANKDKEINDLKVQIENNNKEINTLKEEINKIKTESENKIKEQSEEISKLKSDIENNVENKKLIQINKSIESELEKYKKIIMPLPLGKNAYDISLNFSSIKSIKEGWNLSFSELGLNYFTTSIKCRKIGVLGNKRVGKSFILSKIFGSPYSQSTIHTNEKLKIKFIQKKSKKKENNKLELIFIDSDGFNCPILDNSNENEEININISNEEKKEEKEQNKNAQSEIVINNKIINDDKNKQKDNPDNINNLAKSCFDLSEDYLDSIKNISNIEELKIDKIITEDFITRFMIDFSDILIVVVGLLFRSEQILLDRIMEECVKNKKECIYVIHNLQSLFTKEQVEIYIKEVLMKSGLKYEIEEIEQFDSDKEDEEINENSEESVESRHYFTGKYKSLTVNHLIYINENCDEKEKYFYNDFTKKKIKSVYNSIKSTEFNISKCLQQKIFELLKDYSQNEIKKENIQITENDSSKKIIYRGNENLKLRKYIRNEMSKTRSELKPKYSYHKSTKDGKEKLCILVEAPGEITNESVHTRIDNMKYYIQYKGKKCLSEEENKQKDDIKIVGREFGEFTLEVPISMKDYEISNIKNPKCYSERGIEYIEYELENISDINIELKNGTNSKDEK